MKATKNRSYWTLLLFILFTFSQLPNTKAQDSSAVLSDSIPRDTVLQQLPPPEAPPKKPKKFKGSTLQLSFTDIDSSYTKTFPDEKSLREVLKIDQIDAVKAGYLEYSYDSIEQEDSILKVKAHRGKVYEYGEFQLELEEGILRKSGLEGDQIAGLKANPKLLFGYFEKIINYYENHGYPFARLALENISVKENINSLTGQINVTPGDKVVFDTLTVHGNLKLTKGYLQEFLGVKQNQVYKEATFKDIDDKLMELPFVDRVSKSRIEFRNNKAIVHLYLDKKSANFFNGVIGVLPNSPQLKAAGAESDLLITGDINLILINSLRNGEKVEVVWKRLQAESQRLNANLSFPYLFNTAFGFDEKVDLLKQDTSFINVENELGMLYSLSSEKVIRAFWEHKSTNVLGNDSVTNRSFAENKTNAYGLSFNYMDLDYRFNPRKGLQLYASAQIGTKKLSGTEENGMVTLDIIDNQGTSTQAVVPQVSTIYEFNLKAEFYIPLFKASAIKLANNSAYMNNPYLFDNDLNRLGGFKLLRGFDEQSLFASFYSIGTFEYRLLLEQNSHLALFFDQAFTQKRTFIEDEVDWPFGFGASVSFQTKPGIFSVSYAVGRQQNNPVDFTAAKIHFGFVSLF